MRNLFVGLLVTSPVTAAEDGRAFLEVLESSFPAARPRLYGHAEPVATRFEGVPVEAAWRDPFLWRGEERTLDGVVMMRKYEHQRHAQVTVAVDPGRVDTGDVVEFVKRAGARFGADFGYVHLVTRAEAEVGPPGTSGFISPRQPILNVSSFDLERYVPELYWLTVFGRPYSELVGRDRLASAPAFAVDEVAGDVFVLQLTERLNDVDDEPATLAEARTRVKAHLGEELFFDTARPAAARRVPWRFRERRRPPVEAMPDPDDAVAGEMARRAALLVASEQTRGLELDYSLPSVAALEAEILRLGAGMIPLLGAYLGETLIRNLGGYWTANEAGDPAVVLADDLLVVPQQQLQERLHAGDNDSLAFYCATVAALAAPTTPSRGG